LFTVQNNGGSTKYFNVDATGASITGSLSVSGTINGDTVSSTSFQFGGASGSVTTSSGGLTLQAASGTVTLGTSTNLTASGALSVKSGGANTLTLDTGSTAGINIGTASANSIAIGNSTNNSTISLDSGTGTISIGTGNQARSINIGTGAAAQTVVLGSTNGASGTTINGGTNGISLAGNTTTNNDISFTAKGNATFKANPNSATAFQIQNSGAADTLLTANTVTRTGVTAGNYIKIGNSTASTEYDTTVLVVDNYAGALTSNLGTMNGGIYYNSTSGHLQIIENGQVKTM
jgi:hypothetical protein